MKIARDIGRVFGVVLFIASPTFLTAQETRSKCPPATRADDAKDTYGATVVADPYRWLEDQESKETRAWIDAQDKCTEAALSKLPRRAAIAKRLTELYRIDSYGMPRVENGRYFFPKRLAGQDLSLLCMRKSSGAPDEVLVDPLPWSADHSASANIQNVSKDGRYLFYGRREGGQDEITVHVMDADARKDLPDVLSRAVYFSVEPTKDNAGIYYTKTTAEGPRAYYHAMGTDPAKDTLLFGQKLGKEMILLVQPSEDDNYLCFVVFYGSGSERTEVYVQNLKEHGPIIPVVNDQNSLFFPSWGGDALFLQTNWKAPLWHVYTVDLKNLSHENWREVVPESDIKLEDLTPVGGKLVATYLRNANSEVKVYEPDGKSSYAISLPTLGTADVTGRWTSPLFRYEFTSFNYAPTIFEYNLPTKQSTVWAKSSAPLQPENFQVDQVWYSSTDGTKVPMFLFYQKGMTKNGNNPVFLTAYGGFDSSETPSFGQQALVFAENGGIVAVPNLRGGGEFGENWHKAGMLEKKQNVFDDFEAAADYLVGAKYTRPEKLSIVGGSNGGLLVGAALTQRPELYRAVVCLYPLEDMLRFQKFLDGPYWVAEYGSSDDPKQFSYLYAYSPYHHVKAGVKYPAVLFITGDGDTRVAPLHARKMAASLQAATSSDRPILLLYDTKSGHSGGRPVNKEIEERTDVLSFLFWQLGVQ
jgi:prolyl oligopeptidase